MLGAGARSLDHARPPAVVGLAEPVEESGERGRGGFLHLLGQAGLRAFIAAPLEHLGAVDDPRYQRAHLVLCLRATGLHALACLDALGRGRDALVLQRILSGAGGGNQARQRFGLRARHVYVDDRVVRARGTGVGEHGAFVDAPSVTYPYRDVVTGRRRFGAEVRDQLARLLAGSVRQPHRPDRLLHGGREESRALCAHAGEVGGQPALPVAELGFPVAALPGLQAVLPVELQQRARRDQLVQQGRQPAA